MKTTITAIIALIFFSCNKPSFEDNRTEKQVKFISYVQEWRDSINKTTDNKIQRNKLLETSIPAVKSYIKDSLNLSIQTWQVKVINKTEDYLYTGSVQLKLGIAFDPYDTRSRAINQSIILKTIIPASDKAIIEAIKSLEVDEYLKINGNFIQKGDFIDIDSYSHYKFSKNVLDNPQFEAKITSIEKL
ncbi:hypothetical protein [Daejeonella sp.]|jgi:hypothetical protein|uniref:hypothetical protein n=1 Tax=Daejeonella sp. TaxID=2805397 RepID=UPI0037C09719